MYVRNKGKNSKLATKIAAASIIRNLELLKGRQGPISECLSTRCVRYCRIRGTFWNDMYTLQR